MAEGLDALCKMNPIGPIVLAISEEPLRVLHGFLMGIPEKEKKHYDNELKNYH